MNDTDTQRNISDEVAETLTDVHNTEVKETSRVETDEKMYETNRWGVGTKLGNKLTHPKPKKRKE